jgi:hypothetical protein
MVLTSTEAEVLQSYRRLHWTMVSACVMFAPSQWIVESVTGNELLGVLAMFACMCCGLVANVMKLQVVCPRCRNRMARRKDANFLLAFNNFKTNCLNCRFPTP